MLAGTAAFDRKSYKEAIRFWERLQQDLPAGSEMLADVEGSLHEARAFSCEKVAAPSVQKEKAVSSAGISGTVRISPALCFQSGDAKPQAGDLEGISAAVAPDGRVVDIEINQVVQ